MYPTSWILSLLLGLPSQFEVELVNALVVVAEENEGGLLKPRADSGHDLRGLELPLSRPMPRSAMALSSYYCVRPWDGIRTDPRVRPTTYWRKTCKNVRLELP